MTRSYIFLLAVLMTGCYQDVDNTTSETEVDPVPTLVNTKLSGSVTGQSGELLDDYELSWYNGRYTGESGYFITDLLLADKAGHTVFVLRDGRAQGLYQLPVFENDINSLVLQVSDPQLVTLASGESAEIASTVSATAAGGAVINTLALGSDVLTTAYDSDGRMLQVENATVWHVELSAAAELNISESSQALLRYDDEDGSWRTIGAETAPAITNTGFYAIANLQEGVLVQGRVLRDADPVAYQWYQSDSRDGRSTARGNWVQVLPARAGVDIMLVDPCQKELSSVEIITMDEPSVVDIVVGPQAVYQPIEATIIDCAGEPATDAIVQITESDGTEVLYFYSDPDVSSSVLLCSDEFDIAAYDIESQQAGLSIPWLVDIDDDITYLSTCPDYADGYAYLSIDGNVKVYPSFDIQRTGTDILLTDADDRVKLLLRGDTKGAYNVNEVNVSIQDPEYAGGLGYAVSCENSPLGCGISDLYVSHLEESDGWVRVTFAGDVWMQTLNPLSAGTYRVEGIILTKL